MKAGTLADFVLYRKQHNSPLSEDECRIIISQLLNGLKYIHSNNLLHRDLKPANILMKSFHTLENSIKIADFGLCTKVKCDSNYNPNERCGTRSYMAPEQIEGRQYFKGVDIWATGIILYVLLCGKHPFFKKKEKTKNYVDKMMNVKNSMKVNCSK